MQVAYFMSLVNEYLKEMFEYQVIISLVNGLIFLNDKLRSANCLRNSCNKFHEYNQFTKYQSQFEI